MIYYELLEDNTIGRSTNNIKVAQLNGYYNIGRIVEDEEDIVTAYDNKRYLKGTEPAKPQELIDQELLEELRQQREEECFSIINRGQVWYSTLTEEQLAELQTWYKAWLDVIETKVIPEKPRWIK